MSEFEEYKEINDVEHKSLSDRIKSIGIINKILLVVLLSIFGVMLSVLFSINHYAAKSYEARVDSFNSIQHILKKTEKNINWTHAKYKEETKKNTTRSKDNSKRLTVVEMKAGIY